MSHGSIHSCHGQIIEPVRLVRVDTLSGINVPRTLAQWDSLLKLHGCTMGPPSHQWELQSAGDPQTDTFGSISLSLDNSPAIQKAVDGWTRLAVGFSGADGAGEGMSGVGVADPETTSFVILVLAQPTDNPPPSTPSAMISYGIDTTFFNPDGTISIIGDADQADGTANYIDPAPSVHPYVLSINASAETTKLYTDLEKLEIDYAPSGTALALQITSAEEFGTDYLFAVAWDGVNATDVNISKLLRSLGYSPSWS